MDDLVSLCNQEPLLALALLITAGTFLGQLRCFGISLGPSGVLFVGMVLGHWGMQLPSLLAELGVVLFVYAVGLQAGPHFLRTVRRHGWSYLLLALLTLGLAWITAFIAAKTLGLDPALATGIYAGALTSTPGLAASLQALDDPAVSVGFGVAYPLGIIGVVLFVQVVPRILRINWNQEIERANASEERPAIEVVWLRIANPQIEGKMIGEVEATFKSRAVISRVIDKYVAMSPQAETRLCLDQHVRVVGTAEDIQRLELLLGPRVEDFQEPRSSISSTTLVVTEEKLCGKSLEKLRFRERYGLTISRIWRDDFEFVPRAQTTLEFGDEIRLVGDVADIQRVEPILGHKAERLHDTKFLPLAIGLLAGILLSKLPIVLPNGISIQLGMAGGPLVAGLCAGHYGRIAKLNFRMPVAARKFVHDLGLVLFLSGAGVAAGASFWPVLQSQGITLLVVAASVTAVPLFGALVLARVIYGWDALNCLGAVCGAMTSTPGLGVVAKMTDSSVPSTAYVAVYPMALLTVTLLAPLLGTVL